MSASMTDKRPQNWITKINKLPLATLGIILINVIVTIFARLDLHDFITDYGLIPDNVNYGRLFTANFVHDGFIHLGINMALLLLFGWSVERAMGRLEYVLFYIGACLAASILHVAIVFATLPPMYASRAVVGASGAVAGVMGVYAVRFHRKVFRIFGIDIRALLLISVWLAIQVILGILGLYEDSFLGLDLKRVAYWSHLGGFTFGMVVALLANMALNGERAHLVAEAERQYDEGNLLGAIRSYESLLKYDPDNGCAHAELGRLWALLDEEEQSLPGYQNAIELYVSQGKEEEALDRAEEMKRFWPTATVSASVRLRFALHLEETGQPQLAIEAFRQIVNEDPDTQNAQMSLLKIGQLQMSSLRDPKAAVITLRSFLASYPKSEWRKFVEESLERAERELKHKNHIS